MQWIDFVDEFLEDMRLQGRAEGTLLEYSHRIRDFAEWMDTHEKPITARKSDFLPHYVQAKLQKGLKISTLRSRLSAIRVYMVWARDHGYIKEVPFTPADYPQATSTKRIKRLSDSQLKIFLSHIDTLQPNARAAFYLMLGTGARVGEVAHLRPVDVSLRGQSVYVDIKDAKWGSDRCIPITDAKAAQVVWEYRQEATVDSRPLFRVSKRTLQGYATEFAKKTGIPLHCHLLRHTYAALLTEKGIPLPTIQYLLGHRSMAMTAHYAQSALTDLSGVKTKI